MISRRQMSDPHEMDAALRRLRNRMISQSTQPRTHYREQSHYPNPVGYTEQSAQDVIDHVGGLFARS